MEQKILAIVKVNFKDKALAEKDLPDIEALLREDKSIDNLSVQTKGLYFHIWGEERIDYKILDELRGRLNSLGYSNIEVIASECVLSRVGYRYPEK